MVGEVVFGCVTDPSNTKFLDQAIRLVASLRWFGVSVAKAPFIVCTVGDLPHFYAERLKRFDAEIRIVKRFDKNHGPSNKLRFLELDELANFQTIVLLDCDTLIVQDSSHYLKPQGFSAKPADLATVSKEAFDRIFKHFGITPPPLNYYADVSGERMYPYFNSGVCIFKNEVLQQIRESWIKWNLALLPLSQKLHFPFFHTDQISLAIALNETQVPFTPLPSIMNMPCHFSLDKYLEHFRALNPIIIHYHHLAQSRADINTLSLRLCNNRAQLFNKMLRSQKLFDDI